MSRRRQGWGWEGCKWELFLSSVCFTLTSFHKASNCARLLLPWATPSPVVARGVIFQAGRDAGLILQLFNDPSWIFGPCKHLGSPQNPTLGQVPL